MKKWLVLFGFSLIILSCHDHSKTIVSNTPSKQEKLKFITARIAHYNKVIKDFSQDPQAKKVSQDLMYVLIKEKLRIITEN